MEFEQAVLDSAGVVREWRNGHEVQRGTLFLAPEGLIYTDGSAKHVGTRWAAGASAVVQYDHNGEKAWAMSLPQGCPVSAVAAEHMAMLLCMVLVREAQQRQVQETGSTWEDTLAQWGGKVQVHADCMAVVHAARHPGNTLRDQFKYVAAQA